MEAFYAGLKAMRPALHLRSHLRSQLRKETLQHARSNTFNQCRTRSMTLTAWCYPKYHSRPQPPT